MKILYCLANFLITFTLPAFAQITVDTSLGLPSTLKGPHYQIGAELGRQHGSNLFHSFGEFNLTETESATFSGPETVHTIISRVTGDNPSQINGLLRSTFPQADMYFLNPAGLVFGPHAKLEINGSFHASTAHYLRLGEQGRFDARQTSNSLLSVAPVTAFGFIDDAIAPITVSGQGEITHATEAALRVPKGQTLSLIGGAIELKTGTFFKTVTEKGEQTTSIPLLSAPEGRINLASVATAGEVIPTANDLDVSSSRRLGNLSTENVSLDVSGEGSGSIFIRGAQFFTRASHFLAKTTGEKNGGVVNIQSQTVFLNEGSKIETGTQSSGKSADIRIHATESVQLVGRNGVQEGSRLSARTTGGGSAGEIAITAGEILLNDAATLSVTTTGSGQGGQITLKTSGSVTLLSNGVEPLTELAAGTTSQREGAGRGGIISIEAKDILLKDGAIIDIVARGKGHAGRIHLLAQENIRLEGTGGSAENSSKIKAYARLDSSGGNAGDVVLEAKTITMKDGSYINASTFGPGKAGNIVLRATDTVTLSGSKPEGWGTWVGTGSHARVEGTKAGEGGQTLIEAKELIVGDGASIASSSAAAKGMASSQAGNIVIRVTGHVKLSGINSRGETEDGIGSGIYVRSRGVGDNAGAAGTLYLEAGSLTLEKGAIISSSTTGYAKGGNVNIVVHGAVTINGDSAHQPRQVPGPIQIDYQAGFEDYTPHDSVSGIYAASSSADNRAGEAGHISLTADTLHLSEKGTINTATQNAGGGSMDLTMRERVHLQTGEITTSVHGGSGNGGNITIGQPTFILLDKSAIKAQADAGRGGDIQMTSDQFIASPSSLVSASSRLGIGGNVILNSPAENVSSSLVVIPTDIIPTDKLQPLCSQQRSVANAASHFRVTHHKNRAYSATDLQPSPILSPYQK